MLRISSFKIIKEQILQGLLQGLMALKEQILQGLLQGLMVLKEHILQGLQVTRVRGCCWPRVGTR
jgi:hypothetical protein